VPEHQHHDCSSQHLVHREFALVRNFGEGLSLAHGVSTVTRALVRRYTAHAVLSYAPKLSPPV
jgi:hypothetical protein